MANQSSFETLSTEIFDNIISQLDETRDLSALCLVSRTIYQRAVPKLYQSWVYYGLKHSDKSLRNFLQTIIWRPDLAVHVQVLDIREWGHCPRLENEYGCPWTEGPWIYPEYDDAKERDKDWGYHLDKYGFENDEGKDEDYEDSDAQSSGSEGSREDSDPDTEDGPEDDLCQLIADQEHDIYTLLKSSSHFCLSSNELRAHWDRAIRLHFHEVLTPEISQMLQSAAIEAGLDRNTLLKHHASIYTKKRNFAVLVGFLLASLPNLRHLFVVLTEPDYWTLEQKSIQRMLEESFENEDEALLHDLETLHICSALHISVVGHREYDVQLEFILPFMRLKNLRSVHTLAAHTFNDGNTPPPDIQSYVKKSNITHLSLDEADLVPSDTLKALSVPRALESLQWSQEFSCFSIGSCFAPFHNLIGDALREHKHTLVHLDLDIRHRYCKDQGHAANPYAAPDYRLPSYIWNSEHSIRPPRDKILIGLLREFTAMRTLSIDATALCGHQQWVPAPVQMIDSLPPKLETLKLRVILRRDDSGLPSEPATPSRFDNTLWTSHFISLVRNTEKKLPYLKKVVILIHGRDWPPLEDILLFKELQEECLNSGLKLRIDDEPFGTKVPYFEEQTKNWWLGRDCWHQRRPLHYLH